MTVFSRDHKVIGVQYALTSMVFLLFGYPGPDGQFGAQNSRLLGPDSPLGLDRGAAAGRDDITTINEIVVPAGRPVIVHLSAKDAIHSFGVPAMRISRTPIPA